MFIYLTGTNMISELAVQFKTDEPLNVKEEQS